MNWKSVDDINLSLQEAINNNLCVQAWLGYACVLFIGFGDKVLPLPSPGELHLIPAYEIETGYADWYVEDQVGIIGSSLDEISKAKHIVSLLQGQRVIGWSFVDPFPALAVKFENGLQLRITPYPDVDISQDAWCLRVAGQCNCVKWDGTFESNA